MVIYTLLCLKCLTNEVLLYSVGSSAQCYVAARMGGIWGRMDTRTRTAESLYCPLESMATLLISYTPIYNKLKEKE